MRRSISFGHFDGFILGGSTLRAKTPGSAGGWWMHNKPW